ncbi:F-box domain, Galactose oxidase, beta-propeller [Artemisia annua]|uniref:F-box domain, Galactose oxidase, beta-propeller n=1 Tax=Artemisia annua TaxID=35608 RepID=A0A2U1MRN8_ARTAN|nr:F-box domain, Galactose oxidase, beta-propeller [Artemisia annua]
MSFEMGTTKWKELSVPMGDTLEFAALVPRDGKVAVVGGTQDSNTKCVGAAGGVCIYKDIASGMVVWRRVKDTENKWWWCSIKGCNSVSGKQLKKYLTKGLFLHPNLASSPFI